MRNAIKLKDISVGTAIVQNNKEVATIMRVGVAHGSNFVQIQLDETTEIFQAGNRSLLVEMVIAIYPHNVLMVKSKGKQTLIDSMQNAVNKTLKGMKPWRKPKAKP